ncbi:hypothetical protein COO91_08568 [Nostoc flagelliforme CCNUN1]|uniref:Uncharacterized protein n=1 Tax=Nostoc flagelliforme CCNUN1 TaxID=2038116 RepID=A0A2K8T495_9NOSO|nr:hypothetical protein COO91_08568 [Nostoc flagelliforme CCNUN1]
MEINIGSGYRTFKDFYTLHMLPGWGNASPIWLGIRGL